jgi:hypothetical protein
VLGLAGAGPSSAAQLVAAAEIDGDRAAGARRRLFPQVGTGMFKNPWKSARFPPKSLITVKNISTAYPVFSTAAPCFPTAAPRRAFTLSLS